MSVCRFLLGLSIITALAAPRLVWSGAGSGCAGIRESFLAHVCDGGANDGQSCAIDFGCGPPTSSDCPGGSCVIDYTTSKIVKADVWIMFDENSSTYGAPQSSLGPTVTFLVCVKKNGKHCFTETYRPPLSMNPCPAGSILLGQFGCVSEAEVTPTAVTKEYLINNWQYLIPEGKYNPDGDFAQGLRDLFQVTGVPVLTDFASSGGIDDRAGDDKTGSVLRFVAKLRFVSAVQ